MSVHKGWFAECTFTEDVRPFRLRVAWLVLAILLPPFVQGLAVTAEYVFRTMAFRLPIGVIGLLAGSAIGIACLLKGEPRWRWLAVIVYVPFMLWLLVAFVLWINGAVFRNWL